LILRRRLGTAGRIVRLAGQCLRPSAGVIEGKFHNMICQLTAVIEKKRIAWLVYQLLLSR